MRSYFSEQFADKGRPCSTRKQAYREYTAALLRIGAGGRIGLAYRTKGLCDAEKRGGRGGREREREVERKQEIESYGG